MSSYSFTLVFLCLVFENTYVSLIKIRNIGPTKLRDK